MPAEREFYIRKRPFRERIDVHAAAEPFLLAATEGAKSAVVVTPAALRPRVTRREKLLRNSTLRAGARREHPRDVARRPHRSHARAET